MLEKLNRYKKLIRLFRIVLFKIIKFKGPTNSKKARETQPETIRAKYGSDEQCNAVHGSDSQRSAEREIRFFFSRSIIEPIASNQEAKDYLELKLNPTLLKALTLLCKEKPSDPTIWLADWLHANNPYKPFDSSCKVRLPGQI